MFKLWFVVVGACGFAPSAAQPDAQAMVLTPTGCHTADPDVKLCLDFEDVSLANLAQDRSGGNHDASAHDVLPMRRAAEQAAELTANAWLHVPQTAELDFPGPFSIEMFLEPATLAGDSVVLDSEDQYALGVLGSQIYCEARSAVTPASGNLVANRFQHVACTYDGAALRTYVEGTQVSCVKVANNPVFGSAGTQIGSGFIGGIDNLHVYARALSGDQIAAIAGRPAGVANECL